MRRKFQELTIKEKCTILGISSSSFDRYRKLGMPSDNPDEAKSWIQQKRVTLKEKSKKLGISLSSFKEYKKLGMPTDDPDEAMSWIQQKRRRRWYSFRAKSRHTMLRLRRISREAGNGTLGTGNFYFLRERNNEYGYVNNSKVVQNCRPTRPTILYNFSQTSPIPESASTLI